MQRTYFRLVTRTALRQHPSAKWGFPFQPTWRARLSCTIRTAKHTYSHTQAFTISQDHSPKERKKKENQLLMMIKKTPTTLKEKEGCKHSLYERVCFKEHCVSVRLICRGGWWLYHALALTPSRRLQFLFSSLWNANIMCISSLSFYELNYVLEKRIYIMKKKKSLSRNFHICLRNVSIFIYISWYFTCLYHRRYLFFPWLICFC